MKAFLFLLLSLFSNLILFSQDIRIYHGEKSESVFLKRKDKLEDISRESVKILRNVSGIVSISIVNPNPFFYKYELKTEDVDIVDDYSNQFSDLVKIITSIPDISDHFKGAAPRTAAPAPPTQFDMYRDVLIALNKEFQQVETAVKKSDQPETIKEAFDRIPSTSGRGFRAAISEIQSINAGKGHFNSKTLEKDLNDMVETSIADVSFNTALSLGSIGSKPSLEAAFKQAFLLLNGNLATAADKIIQITKKDKILRFQVPVKENKKTTVKLIITKVDEKNSSTIRELIDEEIATVFPFYVRKRFEVVPVVNLVFQSNRQAFSVEDNLIKSIPDDDAKFNIGAMALMNFTSFGEFREYGVGLGVGYSLQPSGKSSSFFAIPSLSYKDIVRLGFGFGYNLAPVGLKNGAKVDAPLPQNISNIQDVIDYKRKPAAVFTIAISGLKL
jgi:hypothetical protein